MPEYNLYQDIAKRTQGDVYIGVVGPVRTGKSTFIKKFMELLVLPNIENEFKRMRALDELPQSAGGRTIMTTEPKFIPNEAVNISLNDSVEFNVRMIDCVGYIVDGAIGHIEDEMPRMVVSPWNDEPIPFELAAEIGTKKVISDHSTVGIVMTSDGSVCEIDRNDYIPAEDRVISELKEMDKPFVVILNSTNPYSDKAKACKKRIEEKFGVTVIPLNCMALTEDDVNEIIKSILFEFPVCDVGFYLPDWIASLPEENKLKNNMCSAIYDSFGEISKIAEAVLLPDKLKEYDFISEIKVENIALGTGTVEIKIDAGEELFFDTVKEQTGFIINNNTQLMELLVRMADVNRKFEKIATALDEVNQVGYGIVTPDIDELTLEEPEIVKQGSRFGVRLKASASSIHIMCNKPKSLEAA